MKTLYETVAYADAKTVQIVQPDGRRIIFNHSASNPSLCASARASDEQVIESAHGFEWHWPDGRLRGFERGGGSSASSSRAARG